MTDLSPTVRRRELGLRLRKLRNELGLNVEDVANSLLCSPAKISRMETGSRRPTLRDVRDLCALYRVDESVAAYLMNLAREARQQGWWTQYEDLNKSPYIGLEQGASSITSYSMHYFHGLTQTEEYAQEVVHAVSPEIDPGIIRQRAQAQLSRQQLLQRETSPLCRLLMDEAVLHRPVGGAALMAAQIDKTIKLASSGKVTLQVVPFEVGAYSVADINFTLLEFDEAGLSPVVFVEGLASVQYYERQPDIARYRECVERMRDSALSPRDSVQRLVETRKTYDAGSSALIPEVTDD